MRFLIAIGLLIPTLSFSQIFSNDVISSNGEYTSSANATLTWTLGEIAVESYSSTNITLTEGFHQCLTCIASSIDEIDADVNIAVFPNPFNANVSIVIDGYNAQLDLVITDMLGKEVYKTIYNGVESKTLDLQFLSPGAYTLQIITDYQIIKTSKIIKQ